MKSISTILCLYLLFTFSCKTKETATKEKKDIEFFMVSKSEKNSLSLLNGETSTNNAELEKQKEDSMLNSSIRINISFYEDNKRSVQPVDFTMQSHIEVHRYKSTNNKHSICVFKSHLTTDPMIAGRLHLFGNTLGNGFYLKTHSRVTLSHIIDTSQEDSFLDYCILKWNESYSDLTKDNLQKIGQQLKMQLPKEPCKINKRLNNTTDKQCARWSQQYFPKQNIIAVCVNQVDSLDDYGFCSIRAKNGGKCPLFLSDIKKEYPEDTTYNVYTSGQDFFCDHQTNSRCEATSTLNSYGICRQR